MSLTQILFSFNGRVGRKIFWLWQIVTVVVAMVAMYIDSAMSGGEAAATGGIVTTILSLILLWPDLAVAIKRCHDRNHRGWFLLIGLIPIIGWLWLLIDLGFLGGTMGDNRFGTDPHDR